MANTFFGFDTLNDHEITYIGGEDVVDGRDGEESEYDALNDETFGGLGDSAVVDDWEQQHEQFAEIAENNKHIDHLENCISQLVCDDSDESISSDGDIFNSNNLLLSLKQSLSKELNLYDNNGPKNEKSVWKHEQSGPPPAQPGTNSQVPSKICTVEELERGLMQQKPMQFPPKYSGPMWPVQPPVQPPQHYPPGLYPIGKQLPPGFGLMIRPNMPPQPANIPPGFRMPMPAQNMMLRSNYLGQYLTHAPPPGKMMLYNMNYPSGMPRNNNNIQPPPPMLRHQQPSSPHLQQQQHQRLQHLHTTLSRSFDNILNDNSTMQKFIEMSRIPVKDEYDGLMTNREKQWLLNIQQIQLNTGTPYFDDYYYTVFKERKAKNNKDNHRNADRRFQRHNHRNNQQDRQDNALTSRVYTPLQFENSLGKLQCGSVTAPRKIIDMDVVTLEKDSESTPTRDTRKTKQLLLELEGLYNMLLKAEDLLNPVAIYNTDKLVQQKQKQRLRELDTASTPEQKQEILKLLQEESTSNPEKPSDYISKIMTAFLQDDKVASYLNIRKGKMLLLRVLPQILSDNRSRTELELWTKILTSLPIVGRRDTAGDNILPSFHPYFKRYIQACQIADILELVSGLVEVVRQENSRSTPLSHQAKSPLYFITANKFGVSALVTMFIRAEYLIYANEVSDKQKTEWINFVVNWADLIVSGRGNIARPIELIPRKAYERHTTRITTLTDEKKMLLEKHYVELV
ncbi:PREDICTED: protein PAT1 homolog 1 [Nicrophorus vespilloides]|uniref:Protein PAT1 homolog 1 n=1 Tax=Nicrophorus vespilloides TaxID=110193 RepID=A0ABM1MBK9_NICVS|nr:PREDICTED: protein PAT1 homolog 1 [Nicrophorus vespilloides]